MGGGGWDGFCETPLHYARLRGSEFSFGGLVVSKMERSNNNITPRHACAAMGKVIGLGLDMYRQGLIYSFEEEDMQLA